MRRRPRESLACVFLLHAAVAAAHQRALLHGFGPEFIGTVLSYNTVFVLENTMSRHFCSSQHGSIPCHVECPPCPCHRPIL